MDFSFKSFKQVKWQESRSNSGECKLNVEIVIVSGISDYHIAGRFKQQEQHCWKILSNENLC